MNELQNKLYSDLMALCAPRGEVESPFYYVDQTFEGDLYRVFTYRLASYTDFLAPNAMECRGHTFRINAAGEALELASFAQTKFFNLNENPMTMNLDLSNGNVVAIMDKLDGSLISTVKTPTGYTLKSKTSFTSEHAVIARKMLASEEFSVLREFVEQAVYDGYTVNFEYTSSAHQIVIGYDRPALRVLNVRENSTGEIIVAPNLWMLDPSYKVESFPVPLDVPKFIEEAYKLKGIEGFVVQLADGTFFKLKCDAYCVLHKAKDAINSPRKLFEACVAETADDLKGMFSDDPITLQKINDMEAMVRTIYHGLHKQVTDFYEANKELDRKSYALKGQAEMAKSGTFGLVMNLYLGKPASVGEFMVKNYKQYGIKDDEPVAEVSD